MAPHTISLNTDIGEGFGSWRIADDEALLALVTDANVACGFHAGDPDIMRRTCETAAARGVAVGAQVGYYDLRGFGRRYIAVPAATLVNDVLYQVGALAVLAAVAGTSVSYVKPHGALYHAATHQQAVAEAVVAAVLEHGGGLPLLCQPGTRLARAAGDAGVRVHAEGFVDRAYTSDGLLVPRSRPDAVITDVASVGKRSVRMVLEGVVDSVDGTPVDARIDSLCVHSDSPGAVEMARAALAALRGAGIEVRPLAAR